MKTPTAAQDEIARLMARVSLAWLEYTGYTLGAWVVSGPQRLRAISCERSGKSVGALVLTADGKVWFEPHSQRELTYGEREGVETILMSCGVRWDTTGVAKAPDV